MRIKTDLPVVYGGEICLKDVERSSRRPFSVVGWVDVFFGNNCLSGLSRMYSTTVPLWRMVKGELELHKELWRCLDAYV